MLVKISQRLEALQFSDKEFLPVIMWNFCVYRLYSHADGAEGRLAAFLFCF